jgi:RNA polymerase sigma-70 factor (ECF subfamily)
MEPDSRETDVTTIKAWCEQAASDPGALEALLWTHHQRLLGFARRKIGPDWQGLIEPEDVLQEAYLEAFSSIEQFTYRGEDSFYHWVTRIIHSRFIDNVRRLRRQKRGGAARHVRETGSSSRHETLLDRCLTDSRSPSRAVRREDAVAAMMTGLARLPEDYRTVVERVYLNQEPVAAVAAELQRSEKAVRHVASRALRRLAQDLGRASRYLSRHD